MDKGQILNVVKYCPDMCQDLRYLLTFWHLFHSLTDNLINVMIALKQYFTSITE